MSDFFEGSLQDESRNESEYQEALCILCKTLRLEGEEVAFLECALKAVATMPCAEVCLELGIYFYEKEKLAEAREWFESVIYRTEAVIDASCASKAETYLHKCICGEI